MQYINLAGEINDIMTSLGDLSCTLPRRTHCSGLLKLLPDNSDIFISQVFFNSFLS